MEILNGVIKNLQGLLNICSEQNHTAKIKTTRKFLTNLYLWKSVLIFNLVVVTCMSIPNFILSLNTTPFMLLVDSIHVVIPPLEILPLLFFYRNLIKKPVLHINTYKRKV
eukprot:snap_masked-scaffold_42-processed-gene-1.34-mRNA-1 protein AED:1.00 eAED:1.00 QI:0/0/0/0/1/1/2/0/109